MQFHHQRLLVSASQRGNALFLILIAVALFAALSYAVTQSGRGSGSINKEQAALLATQITQQGALLRTTTMRFVLSGIDPATITCASTGGGSDCGVGSANSGNNDLCTTGANCLFAPEGGGAAVPEIPQNALDMAALAAMYGGYFPNRFGGPTTYRGFTIDGFNGSADSSVSGVGTAAKDVMFYVFAVTNEVCAALNRGLGITGIPSENNFDPIAATSGHEAACINQPGEGNIYYQVLHAG